MNNYNELIGQLVEFESWSFGEIQVGQKSKDNKLKRNPLSLGIIAEIGEDGGFYIRVEWLVNPHIYTLFPVKEINKFGLTLKDNEDWGL